MVYCNYIERSNDKLVYAIGGSIDDITGRLEIDIKDKSFEVTTPPRHSQVYAKHIAAMIRKSLPDLINGNHKEKMSYEIG